MTITANAPARRGAHAATPRPTHLRARFASDASDAFFADVRRRVALHLRQTGHGRYDDGRIALKGAVYGTITLGAYLVALWGGLPPWGSFAAGLVFGLGCLCWGSMSAMTGRTTA